MPDNYARKQKKKEKKARKKHNQSHELEDTVAAKDREPCGADETMNLNESSSAAIRGKEKAAPGDGGASTNEAKNPENEELDQEGEALRQALEASLAAIKAKEREATEKVEYAVNATLKQHAEKHDQKGDASVEALQACGPSSGQIESPSPGSDQNDELNHSEEEDYPWARLMLPREDL